MIEEFTDKVVRSWNLLIERGVTRAGHISARIPGTEQVLIKSRGPRGTDRFPSGRGIGRKDIIRVDLKGKVLKSGKDLVPPNETELHLAIYRSRPEVMSVVHAHPDWAVLLTACEKPLIPIYAAYNPPGMALLMEGIPIYRRSVTIVNEELGRDFITVMGDKNACLLRGHGTVTSGTSVEECTHVSLNLYELLRMNYLAYALGDPKPVPEEDMEEYRRRWSS